MVYTILRCLLSSAQLHIGEQSALLNTLIGSLYYLDMRKILVRLVRYSLLEIEYMFEYEYILNNIIII